MVAFLVGSATDVAVIVAVPAETGVTTPLTTVAKAELLEVQVTSLFAASDGVIVAVIVLGSAPAIKVIVAGETVIFSTFFGVSGFAVTVTSVVAFLVRSATEVAVIVAVPAEIGVTTPLATVATAGLLEVQVISLFSASDGVIVAVIV